MISKSQNFLRDELDEHDLDCVSGGTSDLIYAIGRGVQRVLNAANDQACRSDPECAKGMVQ